MTTDIVRELGYLTLGTRLKRIGEQLQGEAQRIFASHDLDVPSAQWPFLAAIDRFGPVTVGDLARAVGVAQPGATRTVGQLVEQGLVAVSSSEDDLRRRSVALTAKGKRLVAAGKRAAWPAIERAVRELCDELHGPLLRQLDALEEGLRSKRRR